MTDGRERRAKLQAMKRGAFALSMAGATLAGRAAGAAGTPAPANPLTTPGAAIATSPPAPSASPSALSPATPGAISRLFTSPALQPSWFTPGELDAVPIDAWRTIVDEITRALGPYRSVTPNGPGVTVAFVNGTVQATAAVDASGAFGRLLFDRMQSAAVATRLAALFKTTPVPAEWFSDTTLAVSPIDRLRTMFGAIGTQFGTFEKATPARDGTYTVTFTKGALTFYVFLDGDGKIEELRFIPAKTG